MVNRDNKLVLAAGNPTWERKDAGAVDTVLAVDGGKSEHLPAYLTGGMYFTLFDDALTSQLRNAKKLVWTLPVGSYAADISSLGNAMDAVRLCNDREGNGLGGARSN
jgi:hypothetical protein